MRTFPFIGQPRAFSLRAEELSHCLVLSRHTDSGLHALRRKKATAGALFASQAACAKEEAQIIEAMTAAALAEPVCLGKLVFFGAALFSAILIMTASAYCEPICQSLSEIFGALRAI